MDDHDRRLERLEEPEGQPKKIRFRIVYEDALPGEPTIQTELGPAFNSRGDRCCILAPLSWFSPERQANFVERITTGRLGGIKVIYPGPNKEN